MNTPTNRSMLAAALGLAALAATGCETTGSGATYYESSSFSDPWYYGTYYDDPVYVAGPPGTRPDRPVAPTHPIARPPMSTPRPTPYMGGGFGGGGGRGGGGRR